MSIATYCRDVCCRSSELLLLCCVLQKLLPTQQLLSGLYPARTEKRLNMIDQKLMGPICLSANQEANDVLTLTNKGQTSSCSMLWWTATSHHWKWKDLFTWGRWSVKILESFYFYSSCAPSEQFCLFFFFFSKCNPTFSIPFYDVEKIKSIDKSVLGMIRSMTDEFFVDHFLK